MQQGSIRFHVYRDERGNHGFFKWEGRDESTGVQGTLNPSQPPMFSGTDLASAEMFAKAHLGAEPGDFLYITDNQFRVRRSMINKKHHAAIEKAYKWTVLGYGLLIICFACLATAAGSQLGAWPLMAFVAIGLIYVAVVRLGLFNEIEGLVLCLILLLFAIILLQSHSHAVIH
jgi:hypothetical protein